MKGYFSRIAKQSGLRFSGQPDVPRPSHPFLGDEVAAESAPLHLEERVMIPPHLSGEKTETQRPAAHSGPSAPEAPREKAAVPESGRKKKRRTASAETRELAPDSVEEKPDAGFELKDRPELTSPAQVEEFSAPIQSVRSENSIEAEKSSEEFSAIEKTVFTENRRTGESFSQAAEQNEKPVLKESADLTKPERSDSSTGHETERKEYFVKTAEIIEKGEAAKGAEAAEVHKILFQEVQQWVADSPAALDAAEPERGEKTAAVLTQEVLRPQQAPQVLIPELITLREKAEPEKAGRGEFAEQTFELSIGMISVVIEEPEMPRQPEPPQTARQNAAGETKREFSRLSRHYI